MNEKLLEYLPDPNTIKGGLGAVLETLQREAPLLVREILRWNFVVSLMWFVLCGVAMSIAFCIVLRFRKVISKGGEDAWLGTIVGLTVWCGIWLAIAGNCTTWLQILIAPRLFLLEYLGRLM